jgi:hypothetical protein
MTRRSCSTCVGDATAVHVPAALLLRLSVKRSRQRCVASEDQVVQSWCPRLTTHPFPVVSCEIAFSAPSLFTRTWLSMVSFQSGDISRLTASLMARQACCRRMRRRPKQTAGPAPVGTMPMGDSLRGRRRWWMTRTTAWSGVRVCAATSYANAVCALNQIPSLVACVSACSQGATWLPVAPC